MQTMVVLDREDAPLIREQIYPGDRIVHQYANPPGGVVVEVIRAPYDGSTRQQRRAVAQPGRRHFAHMKRRMGIR